MSGGRHTIDFSSLSLKESGGVRDWDDMGRNSDIRGSKDRSGSFKDSKIRRSSFFGKGRMSSFFFGQDESDSFYFDKSATEVEKNIKRAPWYRSLSKWDKNQLGIILEKVEDSEQVELQELINVNINPFLLQFSAFSTEMDYREKSFYKFRGEARFQNALTSFFDIVALVYDLVLMSKECDDSAFKVGLYFGIHFLFVFIPNVLVMVMPKILSFAGENYKGLMDGAFVGSSVAVSGILKVVMLSCLNDKKEVYHYILLYLVYFIIAKSTAFQILFQSFLYAVAILVLSQVVLLALKENLFNECNPIAIVMAIGVVTLYSMGYYSKEKLSRTMYLVDNAKRMQLLKIKDHFKRMKSHMKTRSKKATEKFEVDFRSPIEKSLGILKTLRETDEGKRIHEELEFVITTLKKSTNSSWTPELLASAQQVNMTGENYKNAVAGWLQTYKKDHVKDVVVRAKSASVSSLRPPDLSKLQKSFTPSGIKVIPEESSEEVEKETTGDKKSGDESSSGEATKVEEKKEEVKVEEVKVEEEDPVKKDPLLTWLEDPEQITGFFGLPKASETTVVKKLENVFKPYTSVGKFLNQELGNWNLNVFKLHEVSKERPLMCMIEHTFRELGLDMVFNIERETLVRFADMMERGYKANPYHNSTHAADVLHNMFCLIKGPPLCDFLSDLEILACLYAAIIHDLGHPGVNNALMISTSTMQACLYHDKSVLENFHLAAGFAATRGGCGILDNLPSEDFSKLRALVIELVLATDMGNHFDLISRFNSTYDDSEEFEGEPQSRFALDLEDQADKELILKIAMKVCDIAHSTKNEELHVKWSSSMQKEFFEQGDKERHLGLPIGPLMDRDQTKEQLAHSQSGFLEFVCQPLYDAWCKFAPEYEFVIQNLEANKQMWIRMEEEEKRRNNKS
ncbi:3'5'-cyclic nucleotide phosphodiesterase [Chloropicon primus]|uniref:Phosphodiesterase n=1 Tax=Chloropicon primus TaxID=1764295 RepID=A0A5B8MD06_9CHLO|nr:3'5'-cyclic nucleotide phosphodiesterase [Chloropicon primus]UPQ97304.1 3'5'-cyclic nucleotide phosphodiesterase [Chloropicon primus]|eukprot:QDZ18091.1 3'5'-cyclic nucleotide phosphodiesterase [Chloropicon primus]